MSERSTAILMMAHGSPGALDEIPAYMTGLRGGRPASNEAIAEMRGRYTTIGGTSPLLQITRAQASALETELNRRAGSPDSYRVYVGTRYWTPTLSDALAKIAADGYASVLGLCLVPHPARLTLQAYADKIAQAQEKIQEPIKIQMLPPWENRPLYLDALEEIIRQTLAQVQSPRRVLFTAHSLPIAALRPDEDYVPRLNKTAAILAKRLGLEEGTWQVCFQCVPIQDGTWLGPYLDQVISEFAGQKAALVAVPIGFVADHLEVLYDLDVEARGRAEDLGLQFVRTPSLNTHPLLIKALADTVQAGQIHP